MECQITHFNVLEFEHVSLYECASDLLIGPCDEQLVVVISLKYIHEYNEQYDDRE